MSRVRLKDEVGKRLDAGLSVQVCSLPGWGGSRWLRELGWEGRKVVYWDGGRRGGQLPGEEVVDSEKRTTIIVDHFDELLDWGDQELFNQVRSLRDDHKYHLTYVVLTNHYQDLGQFANKLDRLWELVTETKVRLPVYEEKETKEIADRLSEKFGQQMTQEVRDRIYSYSGGIPSLIKTGVLESIGLEPLSERALGILGRIWSGLTEHQQEQLRLMVKDSEVREVDKALKEWGVVGLSGVRSAAVKQYVRSQVKVETGESPDQKHDGQVQVPVELDRQLSPLEHRLLRCLLKHGDQICSRDDLIEAGWPDENAQGVSDEAVDQVISRIRGKIGKSGYQLKTVRGRGYVLDRS